MLSYILDMSLGDQINHGIVSSSYARVISSLGKLSKELIFPMISVTTAYTLSGMEAVIPAFFGGVMSVSGYSFLSPEGSVTSVAGVFGSVVIGLISGYFIIAARKMFKKREKSHIPDLLISVLSVSFVALFTLSLNTLSGVSADSCSMLLLFLESKGEILPFLLLPYFVNLNPGGASYITSFAFASTMMRSDSGGAFASVFVSTVVPVLSMGLYCILFLKENHNPVSIAGLSGIPFGFSGVHTTPLLMYMLHPVRSVLCFTTGSLFSSLLSYLFSCRVRAYEGGFFAYELMEKPLTLVAVTLSGATLSTLMLCITDRRKRTDNEEQSR